MTTLENSFAVLRTVEEWATVAPLFPQESGYYESVEEWMADFVRCGHVNLLKFDSLLDIGAGTHGRAEISVPRFFDLLHDRIVPWRLVEVGFSKSIMEIDGILFSIPYEQDYILKIGIVEVGVRIENDKFFAASLFIGNCAEQYFVLAHGVTTFTDLLTLIRMLTPPIEKKK